MFYFTFCICYFLLGGIISLIVYGLSVFLLENGFPLKFSRKNLPMPIRKLFAKKTLRKLFQEQNAILKHLTPREIEDPKCSKIKTESDTQAIYGIDHEGNNFTAKISVREHDIVEVYLCLELKGVGVFVLPDKNLACSGNNVQVKKVIGQEWKCDGFQIQILEPYRRLRISFNGLLKNFLKNDDKDLCYFKFNFIWNSAAGPIPFINDKNLESASNYLANADDHKVNLLKSQNGYTQFGALRGIVLYKHTEEIDLNLPSIRKHFWGTQESPLIERALSIFIVTEDGGLIYVQDILSKNSQSKLSSGNILSNRGVVSPIEKSDTNLDFMKFGLPKSAVLHLYASGEPIQCLVQNKKFREIVFTNNEVFGHKICHSTAECSVGNTKAKAVLELWNKHKGTLPLPTHELLKPIETNNLPELLVVDLEERSSKILNLTGGKGCSLGLLKSIKTNEFTVPDGFVITSKAYRNQLEYNEIIKKQLSQLVDVCHGKKLGDLKLECEKLTALLQDQTVIKEIAEIVTEKLEKYKEDEHLSDRWAVRSSAIGEDSEELSSAGQNATFLGCTSQEDILKSIAACWASLFSYQSVNYRKQHGLPIDADMAVVVQKMVPADSAGVLFTCHPSTANNLEMVITSNFGLGESVVSGHTDPDTVILSRTHNGELSIQSKSIGKKETYIHMNQHGVKETHTNPDSRNITSITDEQALKLGSIGQFVEEAFGGPRDIEWAFHQEKLYLLQSRPITTLNQWTDFELLHEFDTPHLSDSNIYSTANVGEVLAGAMTALTQTSVFWSLEKAIQANMEKTYDPYREYYIRVSHHHAIIDFISGMHKFPSKEVNIASKILDLCISGHVVINEQINKVALKRFGVTSGLQKIKEFLKSIKLAWNSKQMLKQFLGSSDKFQIHSSPESTPKDIYEKIEENLKKIVKSHQCHCALTQVGVVYQIMGLSILAEDSKDLTVEHYNDMAMLLSSCEDVISVEVPTTLREIARILKKNKNCSEFLTSNPKDGSEWIKNNSSDAYNLFQKFLRVHGHRALGEFELAEDTWAMNPSTVIKMIQANCKNDNDFVKKICSLEDTIFNLVTPKKIMTRRLLKFIMNKARVAVAIREKSKSELIKTIDKLRAGYRSLSNAMVKNGLIPSEDLIFHLTHYELSQVIQRKEPLLITKAIQRRKLHPKWHKLEIPELIYGLPKLEQENIHIVLDPNNICCTGTPVCLGDVQARACVVTSLDEIDQLQAGDILITHSTDIGWSPYFPILSGVVTELGGLVSHGAVVAREYGLPCIIGAEHATKIFKTGNQIYLSGKLGTISLVAQE